VEVKMSSKSIRVVATYPGSMSRDNDLALFEAAKNVVGGSGMGGGGYNFMTSIRDNDWTVASQEDAETLKLYLLQVKIPGLEVKIVGTTSLQE
jgi:hypothetical protein